MNIAGGIQIGGVWVFFGDYLDLTPEPIGLVIEVTMDGMFKDFC